MSPPSWVFYGVLALLGMLVAQAMIRAFRARRRHEFGRQVLELLGMTVAREVPVAPVLRRAAADARARESRSLAGIAAALENGRSLSHALEWGARSSFRPHVLASILSAEGTAQLAAVLEDLARQQDRSAALRFQIRLTLAYPILLGLVFFAISSAVEIPVAAIGATVTGPLTWVTCVVAVLALLWFAVGSKRRIWERIASRLPWIGSGLELLGIARALRATSACVAAGAPLDLALSQGAPTAAHDRVSAEFSNVASSVERGVPIDRVWQSAELPRFVVDHLIVGRSITRDGLAARMNDLAVRCARRAELGFTRLTRAVPVGALLLFGTLTATHFVAVFQVFEKARNASTQGVLPW